MDIVFLKNQAQLGLKIIENTILELLRQSPEGLTNTEISRKLSLESSQGGNQNNYLVYSILGNLMNKNLVEKNEKNYKLKS